MNSPRLDWSQAIRSVAAGDKLAFLRLSRLITRFLSDFTTVDRTGEWDDIIQEVIFKAISADANGRIRSPETVVAFLRVTTRNCFIDHFRKGSRETAFDPIEGLDGVGGSWQNQSPGESGRRIGIERVDLLRAVDALSSDQRVAVLSVYAEGKTYQEVVDQTGIPLGSLKRYLREGLEQMGRSLGAGYQHS